MFGAPRKRLGKAKRHLLCAFACRRSTKTTVYAEIAQSHVRSRINIKLLVGEREEKERYTILFPRIEEFNSVLPGTEFGSDIKGPS
jgi:hypothetical protein